MANTSLVVTAINNYIDAISRPELINEYVLGGQTANFVSIYSGIKGTQQLPLNTVKLYLKSAGCTEFSSTTASTITAVNIEVKDVMLETQVCLIQDLDKTFYGFFRGKGMNNKDFTPSNFAAPFMASISAKLQDIIEAMHWVSSTGTQSFSSTENMTLSNGFLRKLYYDADASSVISVTASAGAALTPANAISVIETIIAKRHKDTLRAKFNIFLSLANFYQVLNALNKLNMFNDRFWIVDPAGEKSDIAFTWPMYPNVTIVGTPGLEDRNDIIGTPAENFGIGKDGESDEENAEVWHSPDANALRMRNMFRHGTVILRKQYVVLQKQA